LFLLSGYKTCFKVDDGITGDREETIPMQVVPSYPEKLQPILRNEGMKLFLLIVHLENTKKSEMFVRHIFVQIVKYKCV